jgi:hypothetical protein
MKRIDDTTNDAIVLPRRDFLIKTGLGLGALALGPGGLVNSFEAFAQKSDKRFFRFAVISDTHIIDEFYKGPESNQLDSESVFQTQNV